MSIAIREVESNVGDKAMGQRFPKEWIEDGVVVIAAKSDPDGNPLLYACPKCGGCHSPAIYLCKADDAHEAAKRAARDCYQCMDDRQCSQCGGSTGTKHRVVCDDCHKRRVLAKATQVPAINIAECFGWGGAFYRDTEEAADAGEAFVFASTFREFSVSAEAVVTQILDDHHEDAAPHDLVDLDALIAAIKNFNEAQTGGSFDEDRSRYAVLSPERPDVEG